MPLFGGRSRGLIRGQTSSDDFCNETRRTGTNRRALDVLTRTRAATPFQHVSRARLVRRILRPAFGSSCVSRLARNRGGGRRAFSLHVAARERDDAERACMTKSAGPWTERRTCPRCVVRAVPPRPGAHAYGAYADETFPSSASRGHPLSPARRSHGRRPVTRARTDQGLRSRKTPRRVERSRRPGCLSPSRRRGAEIALRTTSPVSRPRRPHDSVRRRAGWGIAGPARRTNLPRGIREDERLCLSGVVPGTDSQARPKKSIGGA